VIRVWSTGCSTGEEAYSIAILLQERMEALKQGWTLQVFASDIDRHAIAAARAAVYPASIAADISPQRLARFFTAEADGSAYRINKSIRDLLVFSEHDLLRDPPFSRLDLISCRNLLIYLGAELQKSIIPLFHYALNPSGMLFLGTSESVGGFRPLFRARPQSEDLPATGDFAGKQYAALRRFLPPRRRCGAPGAARSLRLPGQAAATRSRRTIAARTDRRGRGAGQRAGRHLLSARSHRHVPGAGAGRSGHQQHPANGPRRAAARARHGPGQSREQPVSVVRLSGLRVRTNGHFSWVG
jgi:two-component system CheB/CheR fusion protein